MRVTPPACLLLFAVAGCVENDLSLSITHMDAPTVMSMCVANAMDMIGRDRGTLDVVIAKGYHAGYIAIPLVRNNLPARPDGIAGGVELNSVQLSGANVQLLVNGMPAGGGVLTNDEQAFFYPAAGGRIDPGGITPMYVEVISQSTAVKLAPLIPTGQKLTVLARIRPVGDKSGDQVIGGPVDFPIDLCAGCLANVVGSCPLPMDTAITKTCRPWQDEVNTCCTDVAMTLACGSDALAP